MSASTVVSCADFVQVRAALAAAAAEHRLASQFDIQRAEDAADDETMFEDAGVLAEHPIRCQIRYVNDLGEVSDRQITVRALEDCARGIVIRGFCYKRNMPRRFRLAQVQELICNVTGVVYDQPEAFFAEVGIRLPQPDPEAWAMTTCQHELNLLVIVGAADGRFDPDEQDVAVGHVFDRAGTLDLDEDRLRKRIAALAPDLSAYELALRRVASNRRGDPSVLLRSLRRLADIDGVCAREEQLFIEEVRQAARA